MLRKWLKEITGFAEGGYFFFCCKKQSTIRTIRVARARRSESVRYICLALLSGERKKEMCSPNKKTRVSNRRRWRTLSDADIVSHFLEKIKRFLHISTKEAARTTWLLLFMPGKELDFFFRSFFSILFLFFSSLLFLNGFFCTFHFAELPRRHLLQLGKLGS